MVCLFQVNLLAFSKEITGVKSKTNLGNNFCNKLWGNIPSALRNSPTSLHFWDQFNLQILLHCVCNI
jgi:hypothetical protein